MLSTALAYEAPVAHANQGNIENEQALWAARACYLEASWSDTDCVALLFVLRKRAARTEQSWVQMLREYSAIDANNPRAREVREFPWGDIPGKGSKFNERWGRLRQLVTEVEQGLHEDPCPRARHWGGKMDNPHGRMVPARCAASTANTFYALRRRTPAVTFTAAAR